MCVLYVKSNDNCMIQLEISDLCVCVFFSLKIQSEMNDVRSKKQTEINEWDDSWINEGVIKSKPK